MNMIPVYSPYKFSKQSVVDGFKKMNLDQSFELYDLQDIADILREESLNVGFGNQVTEYKHGVTNSICAIDELSIAKLSRRCYAIPAARYQKLFFVKHDVSTNGVDVIHSVSAWCNINGSMCEIANFTARHGLGFIGMYIDRGPVDSRSIEHLKKDFDNRKILQYLAGAVCEYVAHPSANNIPDIRSALEKSLEETFFMTSGEDSYRGGHFISSLSHTLLDPICFFIKLQSIKGVAKLESTITGRVKVVSGKKQVASFTEVEYRYLDINPLVEAVSKARPGEQFLSVLMRAHSVRGHFKTYTNERPLLGKVTGTFWWDSQLRGNKELGEIKHVYHPVA